MERIWHHTFYNELRIAPEEHPVLLTEAPQTAKANREKMTQVMFETFNTPALYFSHTGPLVTYASGRCCAMVLEVGDGVTSCYPVYEGYTMASAIRKQRFGGRDLTQHFTRMLRERGYAFTTTSDFESVRDMKEKVCFVTENFAEQTLLSQCSSIGETV
jgi:actin-related protein